MREDDVRGRCLAVISHELMNAHLGEDPDAIVALAALEELGFGLISLPPVTQSGSVQAEALEQLFDQLQDYLRHGYAAIIVESTPADALLERLETICRSHGAGLPQRIRLGTGFRASIEAVLAGR